MKLFNETECQNLEYKAYMQGVSNPLCRIDIHQAHNQARKLYPLSTLDFRPRVTKNVTSDSTQWSPEIAEAMRSY